MLLTSLPDDHVTTVSILGEHVEIDDVFFNEIISLTDHSIANEKILNAVILMVNRDGQIRGFSQLLKLLMKNDFRSSYDMGIFEIGKFYGYIHMCVRVDAYIQYIHTCIQM